MKIWEIDRTQIGKIYGGFSENGILWKVDQNKNIIRVSNGKIIEDYYSLSMILDIDFCEVRQPKQFSEDEKTIARNITKHVEYIARDEDGELWGYEEKPHKYSEGIAVWTDDSSAESLVIFTHLFQQIQWSDEEPTLISDIVK